MARSSRSQQLAPSFFAFQDIIASVIGILLLIALRLALEIVESSAPGTPGQESMDAPKGAPAQIAESLQALVEVNRHNAELSEQLEEFSGEIAPAHLAREVAVLTVNLEVESKVLQGLREKAQDLRAELDHENQNAGIPRMLGELEKAEFELARLARSAPEQVAALEALREAVQQLDQNLIAERKLDNQLLLIPSSARRLKDPIILVVEKAELILMSLETREPFRLPYTGNPLAALNVALDEFRSDQQYVVIFFKPSTAARFVEVREYVRNQGFEVGYDLLGETTNLHLGEQAGN